MTTARVDRERVLVSFAINHMTVAHTSYEMLLQLSASLGCVGVELRNDLSRTLFDGDSPESAGAAARRKGLRILALSEVKDFNDFSSAKLEEAKALMEIAVACGAEAISLIPRNDGVEPGTGDRQANLYLALGELNPLLEDHDLIGLIEPLGFETSSLRHKAEIVKVIETLGAMDRFKLVHDTFHHYLSGDRSIFPEHTGIIHISGVVEPELSVQQMRDEHRVLVDERDRLENIAQIGAFVAAGYTGPVSYEVFSPTVHALTDPKAELSGSFDIIASGLNKMAA